MPGDNYHRISVAKVCEEGEMRKALKTVPNKGEFPFLFHYLYHRGQRGKQYYTLVYAKNIKTAKVKLMKQFRKDEIYCFSGPFDSPGPGSSTLL